ncbi:MAG: hypothetical protein M3R02_05860 [Chloroflexota bacterium]|nr:hypothetical protein [Chloroflexota bacterium]
MVHARHRLLAYSAVIALLAFVGIGGLRGYAQDATPGAGAMASVPHPAHIHAGNCETLDPNPLFPLADVSMPTADMGMMASPMASPMAGGMMGSMTATSAAYSTTTLDIALTDILAAEHAINVHESAENIQNYIACGAIGGMAGDDVFVGLSEVNNSGFSGIAWLHANEDNTTTVTVFLAQGLAGGTTGAGMDMATPMASPVS